MHNVTEIVISHVAVRERARRFHGSDDVSEAFRLDFDEAREIIDAMTNMELLEVIDLAMSEAG